MSIATRINSIEEHIENAYDKLDDLGIDLTDVDKNIDNIAAVLEEYYDDQPKVIGEGTEVTLEGTKVGKMGIDIKGNSVQDGEPTPDNPVKINSAGDNVNLFDKSTVTQNYRIGSDGVYYPDSNYFLTDYIAVKPNTTYTGNTPFVNAYNRIAFYDANKNYIGKNDGGDNYFITTITNTKYIKFAKAKIQLDTFKLVEGTNTGGYSAYGIACITERIVNKNLFNPNTAQSKKYVIKFTGGIGTSNGWSASDYIQIQPNTQYIFSGVTNDSSDGAGTAFYDETKTFISSVNSVTQSFTTPSNAKYVRISVQTETPTNIQLETGSTATTYVAHQEQNFIIPVQQPMKYLEYNDTHDDFIKQDGNWYERHKIERIITDGTKEITIFSSNTSRTVFSVVTSTTNRKFIGIGNYQPSREKMKCTHFIPVTQGKTWANGDISTRGDENGYASNLYITSGPDMSIQDFKDWLSENNVETDVILVEPLLLPCTSEQTQVLEALVKAKSYEDVTHVYSEDGVPIYIVAEALKGA